MQKGLASQGDGGFTYARNAEEIRCTENITNPESIYQCRAVGQMSTIHRLFPKEDLDKSVNNVDASVCSQWIPSVSTVLLKFIYQMLINKAFRKHREIYIQRSHRPSHASAVPVQSVLISINMCEASGNHSAFL